MSKVRFAGDQILIMCPACDTYHAVNGSWEFNGDKDFPTFSPSLLVTIPGHRGPKDYRCHSFVRNGQIIFLSDCSHAMAGKTVDLPELENETD